MLWARNWHGARWPLPDKKLQGQWDLIQPSQPQYQMVLLFWAAEQFGVTFCQIFSETGCTSSLLWVWFSVESAVFFCFRDCLSSEFLLEVSDSWAGKHTFPLDSLFYRVILKEKQGRVAIIPLAPARLHNYYGCQCAVPEFALTLGYPYTIHYWEISSCHFFLVLACPNAFIPVNGILARNSRWILVLTCALKSHVKFFWCCI